jgi:glycolate oxidase FAD binding subunit
MIPLDPPFAASATVGGVVAANTCGPRRRLYGTARDVVIGMKFATLEGKLVSSGGMVVKNVAGLDMAKIMIGSFGTLAAIAVVNFKVTPIPQVTRTFAFNFDSAAEAIAVRDRIIRSVLQPAAVDVLNPQASARVGLTGFAVLIDAGGSPAVLERYSGELAEARTVDGEQVWPAVREFTPEWLSENLNGSVVRVSSTLGALGEVLDSTQAPVVARAASGVAYAHFVEPASAVTWMHSCAARGWRTVMEYGPSARAGLPLWPAVGDDFAIMERVKQMFDPSHLLNRGRLYGRI